MGREPVDIHMDKKSNGVITNSNGSTNDGIHVSTKIAEDNIEVGEVKECTEQKSVTENSHERQDVLGVKSTNFEGGKQKPGSQKSNDVKKMSSSPSSKSRANANHTVPKPFTLATGRRAFSVYRPAGSETLNTSGNANSSNSPTASRGSQPNSPLTARKSKHQDEEDSWSVASSSATSSVRPKVTVGKAPTFRSDQRSERRKEYYQKLEEKHQALEAEKKENEQRLQEEQEAAVKQLRKNMVYKANPVPSFYYEGPPPKVELKKLPLTRPKSPNLNRRKSCSDAINSSSQEEKGKHCTRHRHSVSSSCKEESKPTNSPRFKSQVNSPRTPRAKDHPRNTKGTPKSAPERITEEPARKETPEMNSDEPTREKNPEKNTDEKTKTARDEKGASGETTEDTAAGVTTDDNINDEEKNC